ncbi:MAG: GTPase Era, partial [Actinomycetota bacterium]
VIQVVDAAAGVGRGDAYVYRQQVATVAGAKVCAVNKIDAVRRHAVVPQLEAAAELGAFDEVVPTSSRDGKGVGLLRDLVLDRLPEGPALYPPEDLTDLTLEAQLAELVREQALHVTRQEVPHSIAVVMEELEHEPELTTVHATLVVERDSQKGIVIGKGGETLKTIGSAARQEMERLLGTKVYLDLRVKVVKEWQRDPKALERLGF